MNKCEKVRLEYLSNSKAFMEYLNDMLYAYKIIEDYNPIKKEKY